ncbi:protein NATD1 [Sinocyclocheilus anshuiensis]|uniref:Protein NATD1 n=1 Tax=Sinocyclocheilus anshuiensis TaxID=1608454 RepID=A0A671RZP7_9TELE|nr:PREDICTED: protein NATD1-like [Sinocyclocheilus anshuiensis]
MARYIPSQNCIYRFSRGYNNSQRLGGYKCCGCTNFSNTNVIHDRQNQRFTVTLDCGGAVSNAVLKYTVSQDQQVELISTEVPESHRGKGVAAHLAKAALDFVVEEKLAVRISCWYIRKYVDENPYLGYQAYIENK